MVDTLKAHYRELLTNLAMKQGRWKHMNLTCFVGLKGEQFDTNREILVVGRAVNGWGSSEKSECWKDKHELNRFLDESFVKGGDMTWVTRCWGAKEKYNTKRSAFWRVTREIVRGLGFADVENKDWPSQIAWTNLYKISPGDKGNPTESLMKDQIQNCISILNTEINELKPRRIVFLTGWNWAEKFLQGLGFNPSMRLPDGPLEAWGHLSTGSDFVVLPHPERKPEKPMIEAALSHFAKSKQI